MSSTPFARWAVALVLCAAAVVFCFYFVDRPVAIYADAHLALKPVLGLPLNVILLFVPLGSLAILCSGCAILAGYKLPRWSQVLTLAGFSALWAVASNYFLLQPLFGRVNIQTYLAYPNRLYYFLPFHGLSGSGFPSGHTAIAASFLLVFWQFYPRARIPIVLVIAGEMAGLVLATWHYVGDVMGGLFVGATAAVMTVALWRRGALRAD
jgi:membrane-associated phospholipid phosphatase